jgi:high-affinity iron transporter
VAEAIACSGSTVMDRVNFRGRTWRRALLAMAVGLVVIGVVWDGAMSGGQPDPTAPHATATAAVLDISVLVFREGLEAILVLAALTANLKGAARVYQRPILAGTALAAVASVLTWLLAVRILDDLAGSVSALQIQAGTGLLAIAVLIVVMNWFFHKVYWTGWISAHTRRKQTLLDGSAAGSTPGRLWWGLALLGFTSLYREGFEVVLFLQSYRLRLGGPPVLNGVLIGLFFTITIAVLTFVMHRRLPYRRMLVLTGVLLGVVLVVMVGEQAQEMQLAHWLPTTPIHPLAAVMPAWAGLWFACFPTVETLAAQAIAVVLVLGSYVLAQARAGAERTMNTSESVGASATLSGPRHQRQS